MENGMVQVEEVVISSSSSSSPPPSSRSSFAPKPMEGLRELDSSSMVTFPALSVSLILMVEVLFATCDLPIITDDQDDDISEAFLNDSVDEFPPCSIIYTLILLSSMGFRKVDPDRWEFANEGFLGGQKHLLKTIKRRRNVTQSFQHQEGSCVEPGQYGLDGEIDKLKRDRSMLITEVVKLRQQQQLSRQQLVKMETRLQFTEKKQQQTMTFLTKALVNPAFVQNLMHQIENGRKSLKGAKIGTKRRLAASPSVENLAIAPDAVETTVIESYLTSEPDGLTTIESDIDTLFSAALDIGSSNDIQQQNLDDPTILENGSNIENVGDLNWEELLCGEDECFPGNQHEADVPVEDLVPDPSNWGEDLQELISINWDS